MNHFFMKKYTNQIDQNICVVYMFNIVHNVNKKKPNA